MINLLTLFFKTTLCCPGIVRLGMMNKMINLWINNETLDQNCDQRKMWK